MQPSHIEKLKPEIKRLLQLLKPSINSVALQTLDDIAEIDTLRHFLGDLEFNHYKENLNSTDAIFKTIHQEIDSYCATPERYTPTQHQSLSFSLSFWMTLIQNLINYLFYSTSLSPQKRL